MTGAHSIRCRVALAALIASAVLTACAGTSGTTPSIVTNKDPAADFGRFQTFAFSEPLGTDRRGSRTSLSVQLIAATSRELRNHGLTPVSSSPDLLINFLTWSESRAASTSTTSPSTPSHHGRVGYVTWNG